MTDTTYAVASLLVAWCLLRWWSWVCRMIGFDMDAPIHLRAVVHRGALDCPRFVGEMGVPHTAWAYVGPRPVLLLFWPLAGLWRSGRKELAVGLWLAVCAAPSIWALSYLSRDLAGWWVPAAVAVMLWAYDENMRLGTLQPVGLGLVVGAWALYRNAALTEWSGLGILCCAGVLFGAALAVRPHFLPAAVGFAFLRPDALLLSRVMLPCIVLSLAACTLTLLNAWARAVGFGYEPWRRQVRLFRALQYGRARRFTALHKRRAYFLFLVLLWPWPTLAAWTTGAAVVWIVLLQAAPSLRQRYDPVEAMVLGGGEPTWNESWED